MPSLHSEWNPTEGNRSARNAPPSSPKIMFLLQCSSVILATTPSYKDVRGMNTLMEITTVEIERVAATSVWETLQSPRVPFTELSHLLSVLIKVSWMPHRAAVVAAPIRKLWPAHPLESNPADFKACLTPATNFSRVK